VVAPLPLSSIPSRHSLTADGPSDLGPISLILLFRAVKEESWHVCVAPRDDFWLISAGENDMAKASEEHHLPVVRSRRRGSGAVLREDLPRFWPSARVHRAPGGLSRRGKKGDVLTVDVHRDRRAVASASMAGRRFKAQIEAFPRFQGRHPLTRPKNGFANWNAIVGNGGTGGRRVRLVVRDKWGLSWQITPIGPDQGHQRSRSRWPPKARVRCR